MTLDKVGIIGAGAWGTALAQSLCGAGRSVTIWAREPEIVTEITRDKRNSAFLPDVPLDAKITATGDMAALAHCDAILIVTPAQHVRATARQLAAHLRVGLPVVLCAKGIERGSGRLMGEVAAEPLPGFTVAALSGPSFAADVARGLPTAVTVACRDEAIGQMLAERLGCRNFRIYWTSDVTGVEIGGAVKNVLAIAAGIVAGKGLGASAHAALVTRGFAELQRLAAALGARPETLMGLSGLGDLVLTCSSPQSRNMSFGHALGHGQSLGQALRARRGVIEGVETAPAVVALARSVNVEMPIAEAVLAIVEERTVVDQAISALLARPFKPEA